MTRPGLPRERTSLAWTRTSISALATGILFGKLGISHHNVAELAGCGWALACAAVFALVGRQPVRGVAVTAVRTAAVGTVVLVAITLIVVLTVSWSRM
jgi:uncharacterized membrane protein YidH (DUF202 family)